jgi:Spy/CpxP family protein refolding chaperone
MARHSRRALAALAIVAAVIVTVEARELQSEPQQLPPQQQAGKPQHEQRREPWWKNAKDIAELNLTPQQSAKIDEIFQKVMEQARPLRMEVQNLEKNLDAIIREAKMEVGAFTLEVDKIEGKRAELNKMRTVMLYRMRRVLNAEQNAKFQIMVDRWEADRRRQDGDRRR